MEYFNYNCVSKREFCYPSSSIGPRKVYLISWCMIEFMEDVVKLFSDVNEYEPLPQSQKITAIIVCCVLTGLCVAGFYWI